MDRCPDCNSLKKKQYSRCYKCNNKDKDECPICKGKKGKQYKQCYKCQTLPCDVCDNTGEMYAFDDMYAPCVHCHRGDYAYINPRESSKTTESGKPFNGG